MCLLGIFIDELDEEGMMDEEDEEDYEGEEEVEIHYIWFNGSEVLLFQKVLTLSFIYLGKLNFISYMKSCDCTSQSYNSLAWS